MRNRLFDPAAKKRTVSLTLNSDLYDKARAEGINASQVAETALAEALAARTASIAKAEIQHDLHAYNLYVEKHGSPSDDDAV